MWTRKFSTVVSAGPEWIHSNFVPQSTDIAVSAGANYSTKSISANLNYSRGTSTGIGYGTQIATHNDTATAGVSHSFSKDLSASATASYMRSQGMLQTGISTGRYAGVNATRQLGQSIAVSASYTALEQGSSLTLPSNALSGINQVISFTISYHPRENHIFKR
jgi:hypothetical protein